MRLVHAPCLLITILTFVGCKTVDSAGLTIASGSGNGSDGGRGKSNRGGEPGLGSSLSALNPFAAKDPGEVPAAPDKVTEAKKLSSEKPRPPKRATVTPKNSAPVARSAAKPVEKTAQAKQGGDGTTVTKENPSANNKNSANNKTSAQEALAVKILDGPTIKTATPNALTLDAKGQPLTSNRPGTRPSLSLADRPSGEKAAGLNANLPDAGSTTARQAPVKTPLSLRLSDWLADDDAHQAWRQKHLAKLAQTPASEPLPPAAPAAPKAAALTRYIFNPKTGELEKVEAPGRPTGK